MLVIVAWWLIKSRRLSPSTSLSSSWFLLLAYIAPSLAYIAPVVLPSCRLIARTRRSHTLHDSTFNRWSGKGITKGPRSGIVANSTLRDERRTLVCHRSPLRTRRRLLLLLLLMVVALEQLLEETKLGECQRRGQSKE